MDSKLVVTIGNFNNPASVCTSPLEVDVELHNAAGTLLVEYSTPVLTGFTVGTIATASLTPNSLVIGATDYLTVSFVLAHALPASGTIQLTVPYWNPNGATATHHFGTPVCTGTVGLSGALTCSYDTTTKILTVTNPSAQTTGTTLTFTATTFKNPYSAKPKTGFSITTYNALGCAIESSSSLTVTATTMATLTSASITRADSTSAIQSASAMTLAFVSPLPLDIDCKVVITFPADMPATTDLATYNSGTNAMNKAATSLTASGAVVTTGTTTATILGCQSYIEKDLTSTVTLTKLYNIGYVKSTSAFTISLYAISGGNTYNVAEYTSLTIANTLFTTGAITSFSMTASSLVV